MALPEILLIDDNTHRSQQVEGILRFLEYRVEAVASSDFEAAFRDHDSFGAVFVGCGGDKQASLIKTVTESVGDIPVVLLVDAGGPQVVSAIQQMVNKTLEWPTVYPLLIQLLDSLPQPAQASKKSLPDKGLAGKSKAIQKTRAQIDQVAKSDATVLILGESGTGKEVVAQALHRASARRDRPFVPVNCGAIPGELLESELFGHEKGAFTGAVKERVGKFELANGGTLFLDEITEMPIQLQSKLLRVLQENVVEKLGGNRQISLDVRVVAATNRDPLQAVKEGKLREDLYYRLNVIQLQVPPLRERGQDVSLLAEYFLGKRQTKLSESARLCLQQYRWPGNVRELENILERAAILAGNQTIQPQHLPADISQQIAPSTAAANSDNGDSNDLSIPRATEAIERRLILQALDACQGNKTKAAKLLEISERSLWNKLNQYGLR